MKNFATKSLLIAALSLSSLQLFSAAHDGWESPRFVQRRVKKNIKAFFCAAVDFDAVALASMVRDFGINVHERDRDGKTAYYHCVKSYFFARRALDKKIAETVDNEKILKLKRAFGFVFRRFKITRELLEALGAKPLARAEINVLWQEYAMWKKYQPKALIPGGNIGFRYPEADAYGLWD